MDIIILKLEINETLLEILNCGHCELVRVENKYIGELEQHQYMIKPKVYLNCYKVLRMIFILEVVLMLVFVKWIYILD